MNILTEIAPWLNLVIVPTFAYVVLIERRLTKIEQGEMDRGKRVDRRCPIETGKCPITRQRFRTSWVQPDGPPSWTEQRKEYDE